MSSKFGSNTGSDSVSEMEVTSGVATHAVGEISTTAGDITKPIKPSKAIQQQPNSSLTDFLSRFVEISKFTISSATAQGNVVTIDPWTLFLNSSAISDKIHNYRFLRGDLEIICVVTVPGNCYGALAVTGLPNGDGNYSGLVVIAPNLAWENCLQTDCYALVDFANCQNVELTLPWCYPYDWADKGLLANNWDLCFSTLSPIKTAIPGGVAAGEVTVFARLSPGYGLAVPTLQSDPTSKPLSSLMKKGSSLLSKASNIPVIGAYAEAGADVAGFVGDVADWFGFTRETDEHPPTVFNTTSVTNVAHFDGRDSSRLATLSIKNRISIDPEISDGTAQDVLSKASFCKRWGQIALATWTPSTPSGTILLEIPVTPFCGSGTDDNFHLIPAGFFGLPFQFWRGSMEFFFLIPAAVIHRGAVQIFWSPRRVANSLITDPTTTTFNTIHDVTSGNNKTVRVGWGQNKMQLLKRIKAEVTQENGYNGYLYVRVMNKLTSQNAASNVDIIVYARGGDDLAFSVPTERFTFEEHTYNLNENLKLQGATGDDDSPIPEIINLVPTKGDYPVKDVIAGEEIDSIRALLQKPIMMQYSSVPTDRQFVGIPIFGPIASGVAQRDMFGRFSYAGFYLPCFVGAACSDRFKVFNKNVVNCWTGAFAYHTAKDSDGYNPIDVHLSNMAPMSHCGPQQGQEFTVPYYSNAKFIRCYCYEEDGPKQTSDEKVNILWSSDGVAAGYQPTILYHSLSDDIRMSRFRQIPAIDFTQDYTHNYNWVFQTT